MKLQDLRIDGSLLRLLAEGGWNNKITQGTVITPAVVRAALQAVQGFIKGFNAWLEQQGEPPVMIGHPLGSTAHYQTDPEDQIYGDIDLQMIAADVDGAQTPSQFSSHWNSLLDRYIRERSPSMVFDQGKDSGGQVIFSVGKDSYVQVDMLWTNQPLAKWMRYRMTPAKGIKGAAYGNLFSTLGEIMHLSIQSAGAQMKIKDGLPAPFSRTRKYDKLETLTTDIENFGVDLLKQLYARIHPNTNQDRLIIDPLLQANPGINPSSITADRLVGLIKGLARSFEANGMFGHYNLRDIAGYEQFIERFKNHYMEKIRDAVSATKFDKAETDAAQARADDAKKKLLSHGTAIIGLF